MTKLKILFWLLVGAILVTFALENALPGPPLKLLRQELGNPPVFTVIYVAFILGFLAGWLAHFLRVKKKKRAAAAASALEQAESPQAPQEKRQQ
ncbi:MAG: hypothetical protein ACOZF2_14210 [Thermodesulfobacteriota bacterium]